MRKLQEQPWAKVLAFILLPICITIAIVCIFFSVTCWNFGVYGNRSIDQMAQQILQEDLSYQAFSLVDSIKAKDTPQVSSANLWYSVKNNGVEVANTVAGPYRYTLSYHQDYDMRYEAEDTAEDTLKKSPSPQSWEVSFYVKQDITYVQYDTVSSTYENLTLALTYRHVFLWGGIIALLLGTLLLIFQLCAAGHKRGKAGITLNHFDKIPLELLLLALLVTTTIALSNYQSMIPFFCLLGGLYCLSFAILLSFASRVKTGHWWRSTLLYHLFRFLHKTFTKTILRCPLVWRTGLGLGLLCIVAISAFGSVAGSFPVFLLFCGMTLGLSLLILLCTVWVKNLHIAAEKIADGDFNTYLDTSQMWWDFKQYGETLNRIGGGMHKALQESLRSERMKTELITNVSHDIKTPLTSIINYVDLLGNEETDREKQKEYIQVLERQSQKLKRLITDLVDASKISSGNVALTLAPVDLNVLLAQIDGEYRERLQEQNLSLVTQAPEQDLYVMADGRHLWRIMDNLMSNALKYALPNTRVYLTLEHREDKGFLVLKNMSSHQLNIPSQELMERFVRGDTARTTEGNGLGLSIASSLAQAMGGKLDLYIDGDLFKVEVSFLQL